MDFVVKEEKHLDCILYSDSKGSILDYQCHWRDNQALLQQKVPFLSFFSEEREGERKNVESCQSQMFLSFPRTELCGEHPTPSLSNTTSEYRTAITQPDQNQLLCVKAKDTLESHEKSKRVHLCRTRCDKDFMPE